MDITSILIIGFGVSMDAFAVALIKGLCLKDHQARSALIIGLTFGFFQGFMTWSGYHLGKQFMDLIANVDHWIAWILLLGIGSKMIYDALKNEAIVCEVDPHLTLRSLLSSGIATSIDALAIGISLSVIAGNILFTSSVIAIITFSLSTIGVLIGKKSALWMDHKAELIGGLLLILMGFRILFSHLY
jgi:putative Mn2+ efflux pump MntP